MTALVARPYQTGIVNAFCDAWAGRERKTGTGVVTRVAGEIATGGGKTYIGSQLFPRVLQPRQRGLWLVHLDALVDQAVETFRGVDPNVSVGVVKAERDEHHRGLIVASVQTLARERRRLPIRDVGLVIADECHHAVLGGMWETVMRHFGSFDGVPTAGLTATLGRADGKHLGDVWEEVAARWSILDGIRGGYLTDVRGRRIRIAGLDLRGLRRSGGDLRADELGERLQDAKAPSQVAGLFLEHGEGRGTVAFWPTVASAHEFARELVARGVAADAIDGTTPRARRRDVFTRSRLCAERGIPHVISNCGVLTEGFDGPHLSCVLIARPTESPPLYKQMAGRGVRTWTNPFTRAVKQDCLLLDIVGVGSRHRLVGMADLTISDERTREERDELLEDFEFVENELLTDMLEREEKRAAALELPPEEEIPGRIVAREFDPFGASAALWLSTWGGTPFITVRDPKERGRAWMIYLAPDAAGLFAVLSVPSSGGMPFVHEQGMPFGYAQAHAERLATVVDPTTATKAAPWRQRGRPTEAQLHRAGQLGVFAGPTTTKGQLSDLISVAVATRSIPGG